MVLVKGEGGSCECYVFGLGCVWFVGLLDGVGVVRKVSRLVMLVFVLLGGVLSFLVGVFVWLS